MNNATLITGASSGIGRELALVFAREGHDLVLIGRSEERLEKVKKEIEGIGTVRVWMKSIDLSVIDSAQSIVSFLKKEKITVDILVNNAGLGEQELFCTSNIAKLQEMMMVNIVSLTLLTRLLVPGMIAVGTGRILMVASVAGFYPGPTMAAYFASKAYVLSLSESLRYELSGTSVSVTALCPGPTRTAFFGEETTPPETYMDPAIVARSGYRALMKHKGIEIPGVRNKLLIFLGSLIPRSLRPGVVRRLME